MQRRALYLTAIPLCLAWPLLSQSLTVTRNLTISAERANLSRLSDVYASRNGMIAVLQSQDNTVRFFGPDGTPRGSFGRDGQGPGEFRSLGWSGWKSDTFYVNDTGELRTTFISPQFKLLRVQAMPRQVFPPRGHDAAPLIASLAVVGVYANGDDAVAVEGSANPPAWFPKGQVQLARMDASGHFVRAVAEPGYPADGCSWDSGPAAVRRPLCGRRLSADNSLPTGRAYVSEPARGDRDHGFHLLSLGDHGDTLIDRDYAATPIAVPSHVVDSIRSQLVGQKRLRDDTRAALAAVPFSRFYPPIAAALMGTDQSIWLEESPPTGAGRRWRVYDRHGTLIGVALFPLAVVLKEVRIGVALGIETDDDGNESVVRYIVK